MSRKRSNRGQRGNRRPQGNNRRQQGKKRPGKAKRFVKKVFSNRREPNSRFVTGDDVVMNLREWWHTFWHRVPKGAKLYWRDGKIVGHSSRNTWPS